MPELKTSKIAQAHGKNGSVSPDSLIAGLERSLLNAIPARVAHIDRASIFKYANSAFEQWIGLPSDAIIGKAVVDIFEKGVYEELKAGMARALKGDKCEFEFIETRNGLPHWLDAFCAPHIEHEKVTGCVFHVTDVTSRKQGELKLRNSELQFRQLVKSLPVAFYTCDKDGRITYYNDVAVKLWGYEPLMNSDAQKFCACYKVWMMDGTYVPPDKTPMAVSVQTGQAFRNVEALVERPDGSRFYACVNIDPIFDHDNNVTGAINVFQDITTVKSTELALRESQHRYNEVLELLPHAVYTTDEQGRIQLFNKAAISLWGRTPEIGKDLWCGSWKIFDPEDGTPVPLDTCPMAIALKEGRAVLNAEILVERPDGTRRNVAPNPRPMFNSRGNIVGAVNLLEDITEKKRASKALKESEQRFRMIANMVPVVIWMTDQLGNYTYFNSQWEKLTGEDTHVALQNGWKNFVHPEDLPHLEEAWRKCLSELSNFSFTFRHRSKEGNYVSHQASGIPRYDDNENFLGYVGIFQDISSHERMRHSLEMEVREKSTHLFQRNAHLHEIEQRYQMMVSEVQDYAIIFLNTDGIIQNWNKGAERIKGYAADEAIGKHFRIFYSKVDQDNQIPESFIEQTFKEGRVSYEGWRVRKDRSEFWGNVVLTAVHNEQNEIIGFSKLTRDLTERKLAEDELKAYAQKLESQNQELEKMNKELASFAYISSHDLQEPLRKIQTFSSRIIELDENNFSPKSKEYFTRMTSAAHRMRVLIDDLLAYSRANTSEKKFVLTDLNQMLQDVQVELKETIDAKQAKIFCSPLPTMPVIPFQFQQLIINLLSNALKFSRPGIPPIIKISSKVVNGSTIRSTYSDAGKTYVCVTVADNGIGFDAEFRTKIFEIFQRLHNRNQYEGTGVGLAICKKIAENHNGFVTAESEANKGATFNVYVSAE